MHTEKLGLVTCGFAVTCPGLKIESAGRGWEPTDPREGASKAPIYELFSEIQSILTRICARRTAA